MRARLSEIAAAANPKIAIMDAIGDKISDVEIFHNLVLFATYAGEAKSKGGILLTDRTIAEARFQGKVGLVLKCGPLAFKDDNIAKFGGVTIKPGEWIMYRPSDALEHFIRIGNTEEGISCRLIEDSLIKARVRAPDLIY